MSGTSGMKKNAPMRAGQARSRMWQSMRMLRQFTTADLQAAAEASTSNIARYLRPLKQAGYLAVVQPVQSGHTGGHTVWRLVKDTGPYAPRVGRGGITDPNREPRASEPKVSIPRGEYQRALRCIAYTQLCAAAGDEAAQTALAVAQ